MNNRLNKQSSVGQMTIIYINTTSCPIKVNSNTTELTVHTSCYCILDSLCVNCIQLMGFLQTSKTNLCNLFSDTVKVQSQFNVTIHVGLGNENRKTS